MEFSSFVQENFTSLGHFLPEVILTITILVLIIGDLIVGKEKSGWMAIIALVGVAAAFIAVMAQAGGNEHAIFSGMLAVDSFAIFFKVLFLLATTFAILLSLASVELAGRGVGEYFTLMLAVTLGMFLMASSTNLVMVYLSIELVSIASFVLAAYIKHARRSSEAGLKYAIYGAFSSGLMLYGFSLLYGMTGTLDIYQLSAGISSVAAQNPLAIFIAILLVMAGFGYKIAAVPFHFWAPDVYEGAPTPVTAFLSVGPKAAGFALLMRFFVTGFSTTGGGEVWYAVSNVNWPQLLAVLAAATMTLGNLIAIVQTNVKRLLAYSSIAHAGYALMGTVVLSQDGYYATMFYLVAYYIMNMGAFLVVIVVEELLGSERIEDYKGLGFRAPVAAVAMGVFLFSLTGLPPTVGFIGKFYLFAALIKGGEQYLWLAVVGILNSVISLYYYARILRSMFLRDPDADKSAMLPIPALSVVLLMTLAIPTVLLGVYWEPLANFTRNSIHFLTIF